MTYKIKWYFIYDVVGNIITVEIINSFQYFIKERFHNTRLLNKPNSSCNYSFGVKHDFPFQIIR